MQTIDTNKEPYDTPSNQSSRSLPAPALTPPPDPDTPQAERDSERLREVRQSGRRDPGPDTAGPQSPPSAESDGTDSATVHAGPPAQPPQASWRQPGWVELVAAVAGGAVAMLMLMAGVYVLAFRRGGARQPRGLWGRIEARAIGARHFVEVDEVDPARTLTLSAVMQRGWSPELVHEVLGRADYAVLDPQRKREPLRLFDRDRVERAEQGEKFQSYVGALAAEQARTEARIRKWLELRRSEESEPLRQER